MTYIIGDSKQLFYLWIQYYYVCCIKTKQILYYTSLTKDEDVKQQCVMFIKDWTRMSATPAICSIFTL